MSASSDQPARATASAGARSSTPSASAATSDGDGRDPASRRTAARPAGARSCVAVPQDEDEARVGDAGERAEDHAARRVRAVRAVLQRARDEHDADQRRAAARRGSAARAPRSSTAHAANGTITTWRLPSTVASPAPTSAIAWCQKMRSAAKNRPGDQREPPLPAARAARSGARSRQASSASTGHRVARSGRSPPSRGGRRPGARGSPRTRSCSAPAQREHRRAADPRAGRGREGRPRGSRRRARSRRCRRAGSRAARRAARRARRRPRGTTSVGAALARVLRPAGAVTRAADPAAGAPPAACPRP